MHLKNVKMAILLSYLDKINSKAAVSDIGCTKSTFLNLKMNSNKDSAKTQ